MSATVVVPYGHTPERERAFRCVLEHLLGLGWPIVVATDPARPFHKTRAVNGAVREIRSSVVVLNDADSICPLEQIRAAVRMAADDHGLVFGYTRYVRLDRDGARLDNKFDGESHGCIAIRVADFLSMGGYDEGYVGWGPEDQDFNFRASERWPIRRVEGDIEHLWHGDRRNDDAPADSIPELVAANWTRWRSTL